MKNKETYTTGEVKQYKRSLEKEYKALPLLYTRKTALTNHIGVC
jgi:hypothetical protein